MKFHTLRLFLLFSAVILTVGALSADTCRADILFIHELESTELLMGDQKAVLSAGYTSDGFYLNKQTRFVGDLMTRFFGKVKESRETTHFLPDLSEIREIDWERNHVLVYPIDALPRMEHSRRAEELQKQADEIIKSRYEVKMPILNLEILPETEIVNGYPCRKVMADLQLETVDIKKRSTSITRIHQNLWVSARVAGYEEYQAFLSKLSRKLGIEAERLGSLYYLLQHWEGSLDPIRERLKRIEGYPVRHELTIEARYVSNIDSPSPAVASKIIKKETMNLKEALTGKLDMTSFSHPAEFGSTIVK